MQDFAAVGASVVLAARRTDEINAVADRINAHYVAAKAVLNSLTRTVSAKLTSNNGVHSVVPGAIPTSGMMKALNKTEDQLDALLDVWNNPLGRLGMPKGIGPAYVYLVSEVGSWISGEILRLGGGAKPR